MPGEEEHALVALTPQAGDLQLRPVADAIHLDTLQCDERVSHSRSVSC